MALQTCATMEATHMLRSGFRPFRGRVGNSFHFLRDQCYSLDKHKVILKSSDDRIFLSSNGVRRAMSLVSVKKKVSHVLQDDCAMM